MHSTKHVSVSKTKKSIPFSNIVCDFDKWSFTISQCTDRIAETINKTLVGQKNILQGFQIYTKKEKYLTTY